jgi:hypothetical protein
VVENWKGLNMKTRTTWKGTEARTLQRKILNAVHTRCNESRRPATAKALRYTLQTTVHPATLRWACDLKGIATNSKDADALFDVLYGLTWIQQFPAEEHMARATEYFSTSWGQENLI